MSDIVSRREAKIVARVAGGVIDPGWMLPNGNVKWFSPNSSHLDYLGEHFREFGISEAEAFEPWFGYDNGFNHGALRLLKFKVSGRKNLTVIGNRDVLERRKRDLVEMAEEMGIEKVILRTSQDGHESERVIDIVNQEEDTFSRSAGDANMAYDQKMRDIRQLLGKFEKQLLRHEAMQGGIKNRLDWGFVEALEGVEVKLNEMMSELGEMRK